MSWERELEIRSMPVYNPELKHLELEAERLRGMYPRNREYEIEDDDD